jgi:metallo-beta-lactamase class B
MKTLILLVVSLSPVLMHSQAGSPLRPDPPVSCPDCDDWNARIEPFRIFGSTYYVGVDGLSALLIVSDAGLVLADGGLPQSAPLIDENIRKLGFKTEDVQFILNSHAHYDHAGGIAALQVASGAVVLTSPRGVEALAQGYPTADDPQVESSMQVRFVPVKNTRAVADREVVRLGSLSITAYHTPGHTPGATSWSWQSCEDSRCLTVVYTDSLSAVSDDGFRFTGDAKRPSIVESFRRSLATLEGLPCDILIAPHPFSFGMAEKLTRWKTQPGTNPFIDSGACRAYAAGARKRLEQRLAEEAKR